MVYCVLCMHACTCVIIFKVFLKNRNEMVEDRKLVGNVPEMRRILVNVSLNRRLRALRSLK